MGSKLNILGKAWAFGDNVNTDLIFPNKYKHVVLDDLSKAGQFAMLGAVPDFPTKISKGDVIIAGKNFGCGSSREYAPISIQYAGISAVIAKSFGRIFFRNSINIGLPPLICGDSEKIRQGDIVSVCLEEGKIFNKTSKEVYQFELLPDFLYEILVAGGLIAFAKMQIEQD